MASFVTHVPPKTWEIPLSVAPMMQRTDRHFRATMRCITTHTLLWTEMVTAHAIVHGKRAQLLDFDPIEHPLVLQVGGDDPGQLAEVARIAQDWGYDEINLNVGCPSERVQSGNFGACLMTQPDLVGRCVQAMSQAVAIPVTVKHRIGVDELDRYEDMRRFVHAVRDGGGCMRFTVHARKAWLKGLSPKENRTIPPLRYEEVHRLKAEHPELVVEINGGIKTLGDALAQLAHVDAVMIGRAAYDDPYMFAQADALFFGSPHVPTRRQVVEALLPYIQRTLAASDGHTRLHHITRHLTGLWAGQPGARLWRRLLSQQHHLPGADAQVVWQALEAVEDLQRER